MAGIPTPHVADREQRAFNSAVKQRVESQESVIAQLQAQIRQLQTRPVSQNTTVVRQSSGGGSTTAPGQLSDDIFGALLPVSDLNAGQAAALPPGSVIAFAGGGAIDGFLDCDGSSVLATEYPDLFAAIGYTWGGAGANFNLPDFTDRYLQGVSADESLGDTFGAVDHEINFEHTHAEGTLEAAGQSVTGSTGIPDATTEVQSGTGAIVASATHTHSVTATGAASAVTGDTDVNVYTDAPAVQDPVDIRPQSAAVRWLIKT